MLISSPGYSVTGHVGMVSKIHQGRFRSDTRKLVFTEKMTKQRNRLPRGLVNAPCLSEACAQCP